MAILDGRMMINSGILGYPWSDSVRGRAVSKSTIAAPQAQCMAFSGLFLAADRWAPNLRALRYGENEVSVWPNYWM